MSRDTLRHFEELLVSTRNLDRVLALVQPEKLSMKSALFDRIDAHPVLATAKLTELPLPHAFVTASQVEALMPAQQTCGGCRSALRKGSPRGCRYCKR